MSVIIHSIICGLTTPIAILLISKNTQEAGYVFGLLTKEIKAVKRKVFRKK